MMLIDFETSLKTFPHDGADASLERLRQVDALEELARDPAIWASFGPMERLASALGVRDLYTRARARGEHTRYAGLLDALSRRVTLEAMPDIEGLSLSFYPTATHKMPRVVEAKFLDPVWRPLFMSASEQLEESLLAFVDPMEFNLRTYENIIPLDRFIAPHAPSFRLNKRKRPTEDLDCFTFEIRGSVDLLRAIDELDLHVAPLNSNARGGQRFIFHSAELGRALTKAVTRSRFPAALAADFSHVNPVFRANRFDPDDRPFSPHHDAPYRDASRGHVSRYTMLLYLTGGEGDPALKVEGYAMTKLAPMTCVIFDQRYAHEAAPYLKGQKIFLRTELVYEVDDEALDHSPSIAKIFQKATYMTGECLFHEELAPYTDRAYDRVSRAHWTSPVKGDEGDKPEPFLLKSFRDRRFITNGYDYWFQPLGVTLYEAATVALFDYFNCKIGEDAFRQLVESEVLEGSGESSWVREVLYDVSTDEGEPLTSELDKRHLFPELELPDPFTDVKFPFTLNEYSSPREHGEMTRHADVLALLKRSREEATSAIMPAPILLMGQEIFLDPSRFLVDGDRLYIRSHERLRPINFAAMSYIDYEAEYFVELEREVGLPYFLVPPILFEEEDGCLHLMFDFFRNGWMVRYERRSARLERATSR